MTTTAIRVWEGGSPFDITVQPEQNVLDALRGHGFYIPAICGSRGACGKCAVKVMKNIPPASREDLHFFSEEAITNGFRLACTMTASEGMELALDTQAGRGEQTAFKILDIYVQQYEAPCDRYGIIRSPLPKESIDRALKLKAIPLSVLRKAAGQINPDINEYYDKDIFALTDGERILEVFDREPSRVCGIAVDVGTTTIAFELVNLLTGQREGSFSLINRQRVLGADVVTRILQSANGKQNELHELVKEDIRYGITQILSASSVTGKEVYEVAVAGNTTMMHLLLNLPCTSLGQSPFRATILNRARYPFAEIFGGGLLDCEVMLLPGISAYVGADITAGVIFCGGLTHEKPCLLVDLGTNGEMALFWKDNILVTSTAAGPAFEAGNISCGLGSVPGAIAKISYQPQKGVYDYETIGGLKPKGLCGSGVIDMAAQLVRHGFVDETGLLDDEFFDDGVMIDEEAGISFTQKDMREIQLAKSAVRSGIEVLLAVAGFSCEDIERVYLAGGFGYKIDLESAMTLGIFPEPLREKVVAVGNTALGGCTRVLTNRQSENGICITAAAAKEINLSTDPRFNDLFMEHMMFEA